MYPSTFSDNVSFLEVPGLMACLKDAKYLYTSRSAKPIERTFALVVFDAGNFRVIIA